MKFEARNIPIYFCVFLIILFISTLGTRLKEANDKEKDNDEYLMIRKYLLNDFPTNKPKLWIHSKYDRNSRFWKSFHSRSSTDLNQPYIHLTIKSIIDHCGNNFNVCLIDDDSFSKLIPSWDVKVNELTEPFKSHMREYGMIFLLHIYGGMIVPNSFICLRNLKELYERGISQNKPFICEKINNCTDVVNENKRMTFVPDTFFMGCIKNDPLIYEMLQYLKTRNNNPHFSSEHEFIGSTSQWCLKQIRLNRITLIGGEIIGTKTAKQKPILIEDLMESELLNLHEECIGIYIPHDQILNRIKYQWFCVLSSKDVLNSTAIVSKYLKSSIVTISQKNVQILESNVDV